MNEKPLKANRFIRILSVSSGILAVTLIFLFFHHVHKGYYDYLSQKLSYPVNVIINGKEFKNMNLE